MSMKAAAVEGGSLADPTNTIRRAGRGESASAFSPVTLFAVPSATRSAEHLTRSNVI